VRVILSSKIKTRIMTRTRADRDLPAGTILNPLSRHQQPTIDTETTEAGTECVLSRGSDLVYVDQTDRQRIFRSCRGRRRDRMRRDEMTRQTADSRGRNPEPFLCAPQHSTAQHSRSGHSLNSYWTALHTGPQLRPHHTTPALPCPALQQRPLSDKRINTHNENVHTRQDCSGL
jgi:hypothetical protein